MKSPKSPCDSSPIQCCCFDCVFPPTCCTPCLLRSHCASNAGTPPGVCTWKYNNPSGDKARCRSQPASNYQRFCPCSRRAAAPAAPAATPGIAAAAPAPLVPVTEGCKTDLDCSLNGVCTAGICICVKPWKGDSCGIIGYKTTPISGAAVLLASLSLSSSPPHPAPLCLPSFCCCCLCIAVVLTCTPTCIAHLAPHTTHQVSLCSQSTRRTTPGTGLSWGWLKCTTVHLLLNALEIIDRACSMLARCRWITPVGGNTRRGGTDPVYADAHFIFMTSCVLAYAVLSTACTTFSIRTTGTLQALNLFSG